MGGGGITHSYSFLDNIPLENPPHNPPHNPSHNSPCNPNDSTHHTPLILDSKKNVDSKIVDSKIADSGATLDSKSPILSPNSPLFAPIASLYELLFETNACPFLPKLYGIWENVADIDFDKLPKSFALKTNHDCGGVVLVPDKAAFLADSKGFKTAMKKLKKHLKTNFYTLYREWHYKDIEPRVFVEELLSDPIESTQSPAKPDSNPCENTAFHNPKGFRAPSDYKIHCLGNAMFVQVDTDRFTRHTRSIFDDKWEKLDFSILYPQPDFVPPKPQNLESMLQIAETLGRGFGGVRIDLYNLSGKIIVGELTFTHGGGTERFYPNEWDKKFGTLWHTN